MCCFKSQLIEKGQKLDKQVNALDVKLEYTLSSVSQQVLINWCFGRSHIMMIDKI